MAEAPGCGAAAEPARELFEACRNGDVERVKRLVRPENVNSRDTAGRKSSPLHFAAGTGRRYRLCGEGGAREVASPGGRPAAGPRTAASPSALGLGRAGPGRSAGCAVPLRPRRRGWAWARRGGEAEAPAGSGVRPAAGPGLRPSPGAAPALAWLISCPEPYRWRPVNF